MNVPKSSPLPQQWEAGKEYLGHNSANTTVLYTHLTDRVQQHSRQSLNHLMDGF